MTSDGRFQYISPSAFNNRNFRQKFDKRYCLVLPLIFALIILMLEFELFSHLSVTGVLHCETVCNQLKLTNYRKRMVDYKITYVVDNV